LISKISKLSRFGLLSHLISTA